MPDIHDERGAVKMAVNRLTAICEYVEAYGKWPRTRAARRDAADLRAVLDEVERLEAVEQEREALAAASDWMRAALNCDCGCPMLGIGCGCMPGCGCGACCVWDGPFVADGTKALREQLAAATARAEKAEALNRDLAHSTMRHMEKLGAERDEAKLRAEKAEARLAERQPIRAEWSTENTYSHPSDDVISQELAARRVATHPDIHTAALRRQLYAGPWVPADKACRSCGETDDVRGDPPLCSNCVVYNGIWSAQRPDASLDGLRGPFTGLLGPLGLAADAAPDGRSATEAGEQRSEAHGSNWSSGRAQRGCQRLAATSSTTTCASCPPDMTATTATASTGRG